MGLNDEHFDLEVQVMSQFQLLWAVFQSHSTAEDEFIWPALRAKARNGVDVWLHSNDLFTIINDLEYAEEHSQENELFKSMGELWKELRNIGKHLCGRVEILDKLEQKTCATFMHLLAHLEKEETSALPLIKKYFSPAELEVLVGKIMGKRPSELMKTILGMMIKNLDPGDVGNMMGYMRQAVKDTYFEKWLASGGFSWEGLQEQSPVNPKKRDISAITEKEESSNFLLSEFNRMGILFPGEDSKADLEGSTSQDSCRINESSGSHSKELVPLSEAEYRIAVQKLNQHEGISSKKKNEIMQALRNQMHKSAHLGPDFPNEFVRKCSTSTLASPKFFYTQSSDGKMSNFTSELPFFQLFELEPTFREIPSEVSSDKRVLGCPHYMRCIKVRAPCCGHLFTCRLCHDQVMDHTMDRYEVSEMLCMICGTLQPIANSCIHPTCLKNTTKYLEDHSSTETHSSDECKKLSKYYCSICHLHDDNPQKNIYHCPYCNVCRSGKGLGIDFCHCMKCNSCVTLNAADNHSCATHSLEAECPICTIRMFQSTTPVKGLKCGHFMHLDCYRKKLRNAEQGTHWYRCPICLRSMEDMTEYFSQLDAVVSVQPMPFEYRDDLAKILCHDCEKFTTVSYHFLHLKCNACGSYNTRMEEKIHPT